MFSSLRKALKKLITSITTTGEWWITKKKNNFNERDTEKQWGSPIFNFKSPQKESTLITEITSLLEGHLHVWF